MTTPDIAAIRSRLAAATPGVWVAHSDQVISRVGKIIAECDDGYTADLMAHAPADLRALCDRVEALEAVLVGIVEKVEHVAAGPDDPWYALRDIALIGTAALAAQPATGTE